MYDDHHHLLPYQRITFPEDTSYHLSPSLTYISYRVRYAIFDRVPDSLPLIASNGADQRLHTTLSVTPRYVVSPHRTHVAPDWWMENGVILDDWICLVEINDGEDFVGGGNTYSDKNRESYSRISPACAMVARAGGINFPRGQARGKDGAQARAQTTG